MKVHQNNPGGSKEQAAKHWTKRNRMQDTENKKNQPISDGEAAATMSTKDFTTHLKKSQELTPGEIQKARLSENLQKAYTPIFEDPDYLEKGKKANIGERRTWGSVEYVKHQDGWVAFSQKTGKGSVYGSDGKKKMDAGDHHINYFKEKTDPPATLGVLDTITLDKDHKDEDMTKLSYDDLRQASRDKVGSKTQIAAHDELIDRAQRVLPEGQIVKDHEHAMDILDAVDDSNNPPFKEVDMTIDEDRSKLKNELTALESDAKTQIGAVGHISERTINKINKVKSQIKDLEPAPNTLTIF